MFPVVQRLESCWLSTICTLLCIGSLILVLSACASSQGTQPRSTVTSSQGTQPRSTVTSSAPALLCGKVQIGPQGILLNAPIAKQATNCFWQAFRQCHTASLVFTSSGGDAAVIRTFTIENHAVPCTISDAVQDVMGTNPPSIAIVSTCRGLAQKADGLHFASCGQDGDIFVPIISAH